jgi:type II secretory pathway component PulJ
MINITSRSESAMLKQNGITVLELLIGLSVMSGVSLYTVHMAEEVEEAISVYENRTVDVQKLRNKLKSAPNQATNGAKLFEADLEFLPAEQI